ncbi:hypothetical protein A8938_3248 [Algoriphagus zhangzhouensis]|uniref:Uncharacterized protein n=1 Tax=Algoriphagus zhangzhouensis TaxID=1073327 RepID=A0A1M7ZFL5_9BACT|nr:hypothetical protein A8938_3248 [Algoriphagus zhangzhouensis]SHO63664.1 hypothetical protein SAMN04488108_2837 [Algoriphagus zhangzhouensis]
MDLRIIMVILKCIFNGLKFIFENRDRWENSYLKSYYLYV